MTLVRSSRWRARGEMSSRYGLCLRVGFVVTFILSFQFGLTAAFPQPRHGDVRCSENEFLCLNGRCVSAEVLCNGSDDCNDQSDEQNCSVSGCGPHEFLCSNSTVCISRYQLCDNHQDCTSGADESGDLCEKRALQPESCGELDFLCGSGQCIELQSACDNFPDCSDSSDEVSCDQNECLEANGHCSHYCWDLPLGYECACPTGLELINHFICEDVDECRNPDLCDQICVNLPGSYTCECSQGYQKEPHAGTCQAAGEEPFVIVTNHGDIKSINVNRMEYLEIADGLHSATALSMDITSSTIFWSDDIHHGIFRKSVDQNRKDIRQILGDVQSPGGIAVDWIYSHIYWTDSRARTLSLATVDGLKRKTLFSTNLKEPTAIAVDPQSGCLYWADVGEPAKIETAGMNGVGRRILVSIGIEKPTGIALDYIKKRVYWVDSNLHKLFYTDLNGLYHSVFHSPKYLANPFGLAVFEDRAFWSDVDGKAVYSINRFREANVTVLAQNLTEPRGLVVFHRLMQPIVQNWCVEERAACEYLCVPAPYTEQHYTCLCPDGVIPIRSGHTCEKETDSGASSRERDDSASSRNDLNQLDAVSVGIIALIVIMLGFVMCCAAVHWQMIVGRVKTSSFCSVHLNAENSTNCSGQRTDSISQQFLLSE
ncbi:very low-density lipoprotein receptor-like isoform X2 [Stegostoma tigrinum]|uniref:very low-density lipoprotein receptor-like isoform X2 n=1 Tax=Stegostoma tigrinum TaxID=3053191 RepID=UPI00202B4496|nr:very low-density lipoprotein receptor-like isoform X2 [Stegostoma tigrinum]